MKIFIICSKRFYKDIPPILEKLEKQGHDCIMPNCYDNPDAEAQSWTGGEKAHAGFKRKMFSRSRKVTEDVDAVLCLNCEKDGKPNYIGGATFLELYDAFMMNKKIFLWNDLPQGIFYDELHGFAPKIIHGDISLII